MQRRKGGASADVVSKRQRQDQEQTDLEKKDMEWTTTNTNTNTNTASSPDNNAKSKNNKRRRSRISGSTGAAAEESTDPKPTHDNNTVHDMDIDATESTVASDTIPPTTTPVVHIATQSDMYGLSSTTQIIGRRSFQNFHKTVETSYTKALEMQEQLAVDERVGRDHITDEELLKRYEKYVKGKGDMTGDDGSKRNIVGNLKNKIR